MIKAASSVSSVAAGATRVLVGSAQVEQALAAAAAAVESGAVDIGAQRARAAGILAARDAYAAFRAKGVAEAAESDVILDTGGTTLAPAAVALLETAWCRTQQAWRRLVEGRADRNADHVDLLSEYWEWVQSAPFAGVQACLAEATGTTVLLSCFACHPASPHRAARRSPSSLFTEPLYFRLMGCDEVGLRRFCTECLLYERYEDLLVHAGLEDEWLRRLLPFVRRVDQEVFGHRIEPNCDGSPGETDQTRSSAFSRSASRST